MEVADPVSALAGTWSFRREVTDRASGLEGRAVGTARFESTGAGLDWTETGTLVIDGHSFDAKRRMAVVRDGESWQVLFEDGRPFHGLDLGRGRCSVNHPCGDDFYEGSLALSKFDGETTFVTEWKVKGPRKDQLIVTAYRRNR